MHACGPTLRGVTVARLLNLLELVRLRVRSRATIQRCSPILLRARRNFNFISDLVGWPTYEITQSEYDSWSKCRRRPAKLLME